MNSLLILPLSCIRLILAYRKNLIILLLFSTFIATAEGTKELLPISVSSDTLIRKAILNVGGTGNGTCGAYSGNVLQRINIEIADASNERIFLGFNVVSGGPGYFRIFDPSGVPISSPTLIPTSGKGFIPFFQNAVIGPDTLNAGGYDALMLSPTPGITGKYYIEFNSTGPALTPVAAKVGLKIFDITVANILSLQAKEGRVSSSSWNINAGNIADYANTFDGKVFVLSNDGFVVSANFKDRGFSPAGFRLNFNGYGTQNTGNIYSDRRSNTGDLMSPQFPVYFNNPDSLLHPSASSGVLTTSSIQFSRCNQNEFIFEFDVTANGLIELIYDANSNGLFDNGSADARLSQYVTAGHNTLVWNGRDGNGNLLSVNSNSNFALHYAQGYINFPIYDAEVDSGGVLFANVRPVPVDASANLQFYDDTLLFSTLTAPFNSNKLPTTGGQYPYQEFNGCTSPCHKWEAYNGNNSVADFGNLSTVNTYFFATRQSFSFTETIPDFYLVDAGSLQTICKTDTIELNASISSSLGNPYLGSFHWIGGGTFLPNDSTLSAHYIPSNSELNASSFRLFLQLRGDCEIIQDSVKINVDTPPSSSNAGTDQVVCQGLAQLNANIPTVGTGSWLILNGANGSLISPAAANSGVVNLNTGTTNLRWKISNGVCRSSFDTVAIQYTPVNVEIIGIDTNYCTAFSSFSLNSTYLNASPVGGVFSYFIDGNVATELNASSLAGDFHVLSVSYTEPIAGICIATDSLLFFVGGSCNKAPVAGNDFFSMNEDVVLNGSNVLLNDTDANPLDSLILQTTPLINPLHGSLLLNENGTFIYTPNLNYFGLDFFTYQVCDTGNACDSATVQLLIQPVNDAPAAIADSAFTLEDVAANGFVLGNDFDVENDSLVMDTVVASLAQNGTVTLHADGSFEYLPNPNFNGIDRFDYRLCDTGSPSACGFGTVYILVNAVNDAPQANFGRKTTFEDIPNALNVLSNDLDVDGNMDPASLSITINGNPMHGTALVDANTNKIIYTPFPNYFGNDTLVYEVCDLGAPIYCDTSITFITVLQVNDQPVANSDFALVAEDDTLVGASLLTNDSDVDGDSLFLENSALVGPFYGTVNILTSGMYTYIPNMNFNGSDYFVYSICDNGKPQLCDQDTVFITISSVNDAPIAANNTVVTSLNTSITTNVLSNDFDVDSNLVPASIAISIGPLHGTAFVNANGSIAYTPLGGYFGRDSLLYTVCDAGVPALCASAKLIFEVGYVNLPPICGDDAVLLFEDNTSQIDILNNDSDPNNNIDLATLQLIQNGAHGTASIDFINGQINYSPSVNYFGNDTLVYVLCDVGTISNCDTATIFISIQSVNDSPTLVNDTLVTDEDFSLLGNILTNDFDVDTGDLLTLSAALITQPLNGQLILNLNGDFTYTPNLNFNGIDFFTYEVCDNGFPISCATATVMITVNSLNDAPLAANNILIVPLNSSVSVFVLNNDYDVDGNLNAASLSIIGLPSNGSAQLDTLLHSIAYTPNPNYFGLDTVTYTVCDSALIPLCSQAYLIFNVGASNNAPTAMPDFVSISQNTAIDIPVLANDFDVDGNINKSSVDVLVNTSNGSISLDIFTGIISYQPNPGFSGKDSLIYEICDGGLPVFCDTALVVITVNSNIQPLANADFNTTNEDTPVNGSSVLQNDSDLNNGTLILNTTPLQNPANGTLTFNSNGTYTYFPNLNFYGTDSFVYEICDDGSPVLCDTALVTININAINDAPDAADDSIQMPQGVAFSGNLISNDVDVDSPTLLANSTTLNGPLHGIIFLANSGVFTYTPNPGFSGADYFQYVVCDNGTPALCDTANVFIQVGTNNAPLAGDDNFTLDEDDTLSNASLISNDIDPDGASLQLSVIPVIAPLHGTLVLNANGTLVYIPNLNYNGMDTFSYSVCDFGSPNLCDTALVILTINSINDAPVAQADNFTVLSNSVLSANLSNNDTDLDGTIFNVNTTPLVAPVSGTLLLNLNGQFTYTPNTNFTGTDTFLYEVCDGASPALCATAQVVITVQNQLPIAVSDTFNILSGMPLTANCIANDFDPESGILTVNTVPVVNVLHGSLTLSTNGTFTYVPIAGFMGNDFFFYTVCDNGTNIQCANAKVFINVLNRAPIAVNDTVRGGRILSGNVATNDSDPEGGTVTISLISATLHGNIVLQNNGVFDYTAADGFSGIDSFTYSICDDATPLLCDTASVILLVSKTVTELSIPNAFSPNGDNINDVFEINGIINFPDNEMFVFNRDGLMVYSVIGYRNTWTGLDKNGKELPGGSYFYIFNKKDGSEARTGYIVISR